MSCRASTPLFQGLRDNPDEPVAGAALLSVHEENLCHPCPFTLIDDLSAFLHNHRKRDHLSLHHIVADTYDRRHAGIRGGKVLGPLRRPDKPLMLFLLTRLGLFRTELILHIEDMRIVSAIGIIVVPVDILDNAAMA